MRIAFKNCKVYSKFIPLEIHSAIVVRDGIVESFNEVNDAIDLGGKFIIPAFIDAHLHLDEIGLYLNSLDLRGVRSIEEMRERLRAFASSTEGPIIGHGWDHELFAEKRWPKKDDIDDIVNDRPVFLSRICLHAALANSYLLKSSGMDGDGIVVESNFEFLRKKVLEMIPLNIKEKYMRDALMHVAKSGISAVGYVSCSAENLRIIENIEASAGLPLRVFVYLNPQELESYRKGIVKGVKLFVDGSLGARTALLTEKYEDQETMGVQVTDLDTLKKYVEKANSMGIDIAIHAIGDRAMDIAINVLQNRNGIKRIEHASLVRDDQLERMTGIHAVVQPHFIISDFWAVKRVGVRRAKWVYRFRDLMNFTNVAFSTDSPVEPVDPFLTLDAAINRGKNYGIELYKYTADQCLTPEEAYYCYTEGSAKALGIEGGTLEPGKEAYFLILDRDPIVEMDQKRIRILGIYFANRFNTLDKFEKL